MSKAWKVLIGFAIPLAILGIVLTVVGKTKETVEKVCNYYFMLF